MTMFTRVRFTAIALAFVSFSAQSADRQVVQSCIDKFVAENVATEIAEVRIVNTYIGPQPLAFQTRTPDVKLVVTGKDSNRVLATATCKSNDGTVTVLPVQSL